MTAVWSRSVRRVFMNWEVATASTAEREAKGATPITTRCSPGLVTLR